MRIHAEAFKPWSSVAVEYMFWMRRVIWNKMSALRGNIELFFYLKRAFCVHCSHSHTHEHDDIAKREKMFTEKLKSVNVVYVTRIERHKNKQK